MRCPASASILALVLACTRVNPAFEDEGADELGSAGESADSLTEDGSAGVTGSSSDEATTSDDATSDDATSTTSTSDTSETDAGETGTSSDEGTDTGGLACMDSQIACNGVCVDPNFDEGFCGSCEGSCTSEESCVLGECTPVVDRLVFVSSTEHDGAWLGGILGIDATCQALAEELGYEGVFWAWNSVPLNTPNTDFDQGGRYVRTDGVIVADSYVELTGGTLEHPINVTETGEPATKPGEQPSCPGIDDAVWSGTTPSGDYAGEPTCAAWMTAGQLAKGRIGRMNATDGAWSQVDCQMACNAALPVYCVQQ